MFRTRHIGVAGILLAAVIALGIAGASLAVARGSGEYEKVSSVKHVVTARGVVSDWARSEDGREWFINGEWTLDCHSRCVDADHEDIDFDMAFAMYRAETSPNPNENHIGSQSHGHPFRDFSASKAEVTESKADGTVTLTITGTITGSGGIGTAGITIDLVKHTEKGHFSYFFQLDEAIATRVGGVVVESMGHPVNSGDDDD